MSVLVNIDVPDLTDGIAFYGQAFDLTVTRRLGDRVAELSGWPMPVFLLENAEGTIGAGTSRRTYARHWTSLHLDIVVEDVEAALTRAVAAGAIVEHDVRTEIWGNIATLSDPFGHGFCLIQFLNRGYDEIVRADCGT